MGEIEVQPARPIDVKLLALADGHSPEEISQRLGGTVTPKGVATRITELLKARNWLTAAQLDQLITLKMIGILAKLEAKFEDVGNLTLQLKILKELGNRLDKRAAATQVDLNTYDQNIGRQLGRVLDQAMSYMQGALRDKVDPDQWDELKREALEHARYEIAKNEIEE